MSATPLSALSDRRFLLGVWPWRSLAYLATAPIGIAGALPLLAPATPWLLVAALAFSARPGPDPIVAVGLSVFGGVLLVVFGPLVAIPLATFERFRLRLVDSQPIRSGHQPIRDGGLWELLRVRATESATWRELVYAGLMATVVPVVGTVLLSGVLVVGVWLVAPLLLASTNGTAALGLGSASTSAQALRYTVIGLICVPVLLYLFGAVAGVHGRVARSLLQDDPDARLRAELVEVESSRARLVDAFDNERRRIERDLHDGIQQQLVGLTMRLDMTRMELEEGTAAYDAVSEVHGQAKRLMGEIRELVHNIHPQVLTVRGLPEALGELAARGRVPVEVRADVPERPPAPVETVAYFVVSEALANVAKHSGASRAEVAVALEGDLLTVEVTDDGQGGVDPSSGTGLLGLRDRVAVCGGKLWLSSPPGGPTIVRAELPCR